MRIAVLFDSFGPYHLARLHAAAKVATLLAIQINKRSNDYPWTPSPESFGFESVTLNKAEDGRVADIREVNERLGHALHQFGPDCVFIPGWSRMYSSFCQWWCLRNSVPVVMMSESTEHDSKRSGWKEWLKRQLLAGCSAALVGGSAHAHYITRLGMQPSRVFDGYDVVDNDYFARTTREVRERGNWLRVEFGLPKRYFLASARFIERKNLARLVKAFARSRQKTTSRAGPNDPWSLVILGDGPGRSQLEHLIAETGLGSCVQLPGFKQYQQLPVYYGLASAFIHPSASEPWGLVVNEAMASGLPILVSDRCGCAPDLVRAGQNGFTFAPDDTEQIASLLMRLACAGGQLCTMSQASRRGISCWGPERFARGLCASARVAIQQRQPQRSPWRAALLRLMSVR